MEQKQTCETCRYCENGHCRSPKLTLAQKRKRKRAGVCEHWAYNEPERKEPSLEKALMEIAEQLSTIAAILKKDQL